MNAAHRGKHILVVEDEQHLAIGIKYNLEAEQYRVTTVGDGPSAIQIFEKNPADIHLIILDLMLPGMSGYAVCETIRAADNSIPILILSARTLTEDRTRGFNVGADQYMTKPFDLDELISRVNGLLNRHGQRPAGGKPPKVNQFSFADSQIDFTTFEVRVRGERVRMTQLELKLLQYFIEREGKVIPRQELLENVWNMPAHLNTRAPDQFIRRLRKTFEPDPAQPRHFLTIRDAGYRFLANPEGIE